MTQTNLTTNKPTTMNESNVNEQPMSYGDMLRETQQAEFPLLSEVTRGILEDPLTLMNALTDEEGNEIEFELIGQCEYEGVTYEYNIPAYEYVVIVH